jgi:hypothetical protein
MGGVRFAFQGDHGFMAFRKVLGKMIQVDKQAMGKGVHVLKSDYFRIGD